MLGQKSDRLFMMLLGPVIILFVAAGCGGSGSGVSLKSIQVTPFNPTLTQGAFLQLSAMGALSDGSQRDLKQEPTWTTDPPGIATVDSSGRAQGINVGATQVTATIGGVSGSTALTVTRLLSIPAPPGDDTNYFQILLDNRIGSGHIVHLTATANQMQLTSPVIEQVTWLTGGGAQFDDWTQPVFQIVNSRTGNSVTGANFLATYDLTLDKLPADSTGQYRILKIPTRMPGNATRSLAGSGHLTMTLDKAATMNINSGGGGFSFALPSADPAGAGGQDRWDFMEFNCATPAANGKTVCFVNTTNVDFFSLGVTIRGRDAAGALKSFGLDLSPAQPVTSALAALRALPGDYTAGYVTAKTTGVFLRFLGPGLGFKADATALDSAITSGYNFYRNGKTLTFQVAGVSYEATSDGSTLAFAKPQAFTVTKPSSRDVIAAEGSLDVGGKAAAVQNGLKFIAAYLNRGVFENTASWNTPSMWYPAGGVFNQYSFVLHQKFIDGATYGFSFDDVPSGEAITAPAIGTCTAMTLVLSDE